MREPLHAPGTGPDFAEALNKFAPPEKLSTGRFDGIITDRGPSGLRAGRRWRRPAGREGQGRDVGTRRLTLDAP